MLDWLFAVCPLATVGAIGMAVAWHAREPTEPEEDAGDRQREAFRATEVSTTSVLEWLNAHVAVLDGRGTAIAVNPPGSGSELADSLGVVVPADGEVNYLGMCRSAAAAGSMDAAAMAVGLEAVCRGTSSYAEFEYRSSGPRGDRWMSMTVMARRSGEPGAVVLHRDLTDSRRAEETLRTVGARLLGAQEDERRRIARELHDDVSQRLALLSFELQRLGRAVPAETPEVTERVMQLWERTAEIATTVHDLTYRMHPLKLELLGLKAAISDMRRQLSSRHGITISFAYEGVAEPLPREIALCLFRIVQEALANVIKHSAASQASVKVTGRGDAVALVIADTGVGFDPDAVGPLGLGLPGIRHRLELIGGSLIVRSRPGEGTWLEVSVPCASIEGTAAV